ncbi:MAG: glycosyltransferase family 87 protein [Pedobacter sp.]
MLKTLRTNRILIFKIGVFLIASIYAFNCAKNGHDFEVFLDAGHKIINGLNIYRPPFAQNLNYYYSPLFALLLAPFSSLPIIVPQIIWIFFSYFLMYRIWVLSTDYFAISTLTEKQKQWWLFLVVLFTLRFILFDMRCVQMTTFLLWATLQSMHWFRNGKNFSGAALLALAINIKLLPLAFLFYLFYRKKIKAGLLTCLLYGIYLYLPALFLGWEKNASLLKEWFSVINPVNKEWTIEAEDGPSSLVALIPVYLTDTVGILPYKRNFINLPIEQATLILNVVRAFFVLLTLLFLRSLPFKSISNRLRQYWEMSYIFIAVPLIYPHQQLYAFLYIAPAFVYLSWFFVTNWTSIKLRMTIPMWIMLVIVGVIFTPIIGRDVIGSMPYQLLLYYRILPIATVLLIPVLWICRPDNLFETKKVENALQ